ncbi:amidohydrolase family protein [Dinghuibacter silviterrae]|uniref:Imidazolonepropionase-like amidohydrolase n=1 Tax=Dinghuibacter silviterrae TaxID=1539049 RepID=A0A4R8DP29_9BACT|nr:amidohydrolase family protein [Dinghuibacter silviterrae]TDW99821.1 imidazolonepropionase-like amidohydrolase [Dinghuibacter silviterrae]
MRKYYISLLALLYTGTTTVHAQATIYPAPPEKGKIIITGGTLHLGNGQVIENGSIAIDGGKIVQVGTGLIPGAGDKVIDATGKQVYPGLILPVTDLGLKEIAEGVRGSNDYEEIGDLNPDIRAIVAYNTASRIINVVRSNGILLAGITPEGGSISGSSSIVQLDAWNYEDAAYKLDQGIHLNMPSFISRPRRFGAGPGGVRPEAGDDPTAVSLQKVEELKRFFREAKAYLAEGSHTHTNIKFETVKGLFTHQQKLYIHAEQVKQMLIAIDFAREFGFDVVLVGASESWQIADLLAQNHIAVILDQEHELPATEDDDIDQPFKTPAVLQKAGVLFCLNDRHEETRYRNLPFNAGVAAAYGLGKEAALQAITLNAARILGIDSVTGSLEVGKDANIVISTGDILDMRTSIVTTALIQGREINLANVGTELYDRYKYKYGLK